MSNFESTKVMNTQTCERGKNLRIYFTIFILTVYQTITCITKNVPINLWEIRSNLIMVASDILHEYYM